MNTDALGIGKSLHNFVRGSKQQDCGADRAFQFISLTRIKAAVRKLVAADKTRGLHTRLVLLDDATAMKKLKSPPVTRPANPRQNKQAIDGVYKKLSPDYLVILGAPDVVPHQDLRNPIFDPPDDPDEFAFSDLPYACDAGYSRSPESFTGPTRVVGRIPDLISGNGVLTGSTLIMSDWHEANEKDD